MANLTGKQEKFCQETVKGKSPSDAYKSAYDAGKMKSASISVQAAKLLCDPRIALRIEALRKPVVEKLQYGLEEAMKEAEAAMMVAAGKDNGGAMVAAVTLRAKLCGLLIDRKEIRSGTLEEMSDGDLSELISKKAKEAGIALH